MGAGRPFVWEKSYPAGMRWDAPIATSTIPELLDRAVAQFGDRTALEYRDRRISYRELAASADRAAAAFLRLGTNAPVALYLPNTPYHPVSFFGAMRSTDGRNRDRSACRCREIVVEVAALDDPQRVLAPGEVGELRVKGANVMRGYWNQPAETAAAFADGGYLSGDIGYMDEDGFFFIVDRKKDMIISGGFNVYPQVIENAIHEHPDVEEALVIGVADTYRGEAAKAFVKLRRGAPPLTLEALRAFLADKLGRH